MSLHPSTENTIILDKQPSLDTDSSINHNQTIKVQSVSSNKYSKKRVGPYSYKLNDIIGSGFTSTVYKGIKDNDKSQIVAIKVVNLNNMKPHRKNLLDNQIKILKRLSHPNILAFYDLYYTINNCYIITEYCEGGSLQQVVSSNKHFDWRRAAYQVSIACQYLASMNIIHRDIKPTNVLLKHDVFKLCDFGFSCSFVPNQLIKEDYLIGSPLYMPLQSINDHVYSTKSDSFALGVLLYFITSNKKFPWKGKSKSQLIENYKNKKYSKSGISHLAPRVKHLIGSLLQLDSSKRMSLIACDFQVFLHLGPPNKIEEQLSNLKTCFTQQLKLCQYIYSLIQYEHQFSWANSFLKKFIERHLNSLTVAFEWHKHKAMNMVKQKYHLPQDMQPFSSDDYFWLNNCLKDTIKVLSAQFEPLSHVMLQKLLNYQQIVEILLFQSNEKLLKCINQLVIHSNFSLVRPNQVYISKSLGKIDFYDL